MENQTAGLTRRSFLSGAALAGAGLAAFGLAGCSTPAQEEAPAAEGAATKPVILVTSFGTSYNTSRHITIGAIESDIREHYPDYDVRRAFTADTIIDILKEREGVEIDNVSTALDRVAADGVTELIVQPTHLMAGYEYTDLADALEEYKDKIATISLGEPLLTSDDDYTEVANAIAEDMARYDDGATAIVLMGHGTEHEANETYATMQAKFDELGMSQYFVGTVEAAPTCADVIAAAQEAGYTKAVLRPLMVVAGDHANNDMADTEDPESWASQFAAAGFEVQSCLEGLGQVSAIDDIYVAHVADAIAAAGK